MLHTVGKFLLITTTTPTISTELIYDDMSWRVLTLLGVLLLPRVYSLLSPHLLLIIPPHNFTSQWLLKAKIRYFLFCFSLVLHRLQYIPVIFTRFHDDDEYNTYVNISLSL